MGDVVPVLTQAAGLTTPFIGQTLGTSLVQSGLGVLGNNRRRSAQKEEQALALEQLQARQQAQEETLAAQTARERQRLEEAAAAQEADRKAALRRAVARQRARFGAGGVGNDAGGSAGAVLLGLFEESDEERQEREALDTLRFQALDQTLEDRRSLNVLQRNQLAERQSLNRIQTFF